MRPIHSAWKRRQVVVDRDEVHAPARQAVEVGGQRRHEGLALAGLHLGDPPEVQGGAAHQLHVEVALADHPLGRLAADGERLEEQVVEVLAVVEALAELRRLGLEVVVGQRLASSASSALMSGTRPWQGLELAALAAAEDPVEHRHRRCRGYRVPGFGPSDEAMEQLQRERRSSQGLDRDPHERPSGLSSPAMRLRWTSPQPVQRWTSAHSPSARAWMAMRLHRRAAVGRPVAGHVVVDVAAPQARGAVVAMGRAGRVERRCPTRSARTGTTRRAPGSGTGQADLLRIGVTSASRRPERVYRQRAASRTVRIDPPATSSRAVMATPAITRRRRTIPAEPTAPPSAMRPQVDRL